MSSQCMWNHFSHLHLQFVFFCTGLQPCIGTYFRLKASEKNFSFTIIHWLAEPGQTWARLAVTLTSAKGKLLTVSIYLTWCAHFFCYCFDYCFNPDTTVRVKEDMALFVTFLNSERIVNSEFHLTQLRDCRSVSCRDLCHSWSPLLQSHSLPVPSSSATDYVTWGKLLDLSEPWFPIKVVQMIVSALRAILKIKRNNEHRSLRKLRIPRVPLLGTIMAHGRASHIGSFWVGGHCVL